MRPSFSPVWWKTVKNQNFSFPYESLQSVLKRAADFKNRMHSFSAVTPLLSNIRDKQEPYRHLTSASASLTNNKTNDLILNLTPENVTQHSRIHDFCWKDQGEVT